MTNGRRRGGVGQGRAIGPQLDPSIRIFSHLDIAVDQPPVRSGRSSIRYITLAYCSVRLCETLRHSRQLPMSSGTASRRRSIRTKRSLTDQCSGQRRRPRLHAVWPGLVRVEHRHPDLHRGALRLYIWVINRHIRLRRLGRSQFLQELRCYIVDWHTFQLTTARYSCRRRFVALQLVESVPRQVTV